MIQVRLCKDFCANVVPPCRISHIIYLWKMKDNSFTDFLVKVISLQKSAMMLDHILKENILLRISDGVS